MGKRLGAEHPRVATNLNDLAELYQNQGNYTRAEALLKRVLAIDEKTYGPDHAEVAFDLNKLALLYYAQRDYTRAEPLYQRLLAIREKRYGLEQTSRCCNQPQQSCITLRNAERLCPR